MTALSTTRAMRMVSRVGSGLTRAFHAFFVPGGHWHMTTSARLHVEDIQQGGTWTKARRAVDAIFRVMDRNPERQPHCAWAWRAHVDRCRKDIEDSELLSRKGL